LSIGIYYGVPESAEEALKKAGGRRKDAAEILGISLRSLQYKIKGYGIEA